METKLITSDLIARDTLDRIWPKSGSPELDMELTIRLGKQLGVDAVLVCKVRSEPYTPYIGTGGAYADYRLEKLETFLVDVNRKTKYSADDTNLTAGLKKVFKEFENYHPVALTPSNQIGTPMPATSSSSRSCPSTSAAGRTSLHIAIIIF